MILFTPKKEGYWGAIRRSQMQFILNSSQTISNNVCREAQSVKKVRMWTAVIYLASVAFFLCAISPLVMSAETLYVSTHGRVGWSGRLPAPSESGEDGPLPSISAARDAIRAYRREHPNAEFHVVIRDGTYVLPETLQFESQDSGSPGAPVVYEAYRGERPVISGGQVVTDWRKNGPDLWEADWPTPTYQLFVNGSRAVRARTPNYGYFRIEGPSSRESKFLLHYKDDEIKPEWANSGAEVVVLLAWAEMRRPIVAVDPIHHIATLAGPSRFSTHEDGARYWVENAPSGLDVEGEWQQDMAHGKLSYWPLTVTGEDMTKSEIIAPRLSQLVTLNGDPSAGQFVHDIQFKGLTFRHSAWNLPLEGFGDSQAAQAADSAFKVIGGVRIVILNCTFNALGGYAVHLMKGSSGNLIEGNALFDLGGGAIRIGEEKIAESQAEETKNNQIVDNNIHDVGRVYPSAVAIWIGQSANNIIAHNHIHEVGYTGISVGWTWGYGKNQCNHNRIEFNDIHDVGNMLSDLGGIYLLGMQPGTVIRNNVIHNVSSFTYGGWGIYLDEGSSDVLVENNIVYDVKSAGFFQHYGKDNIIQNNVFAFGHDSQLMRMRPEPTLSFTFEHNIVLYDQGSVLGSLHGGLNWTGKGFKMDDNIYWDMRGRVPAFAGHSLEEWRADGNDVHSRIVDPGFVAPYSYNFTLKSGSPSAMIGFHPIEARNVGPRIKPQQKAQIAGKR